MPTPRDCFFHKVLAVTVLSLGHREWPRHCIFHTCKLKSVSAKKMGCYGIKTPQPNQPKSLQAMEEVIETYTEGYGGCDTRLVAQILLKKPAQRKKMQLLSQTLCWDLASRRAWEEGKNCVWGNLYHHSPLCFPFRFYVEGSPSFCAKYVPLEGEKRKQTGDFIQDTIFHQVLLLLQALEGNSGNSLSQSISYFCFPSSCPSSAGSGTRCPPAGEVWGTSLHSHPSAPHADRGFQLTQEGREGWWPPAGTCLKTVPGSTWCHELLKCAACEKPGSKAGKASTPIAPMAATVVCCVKPTKTSFPQEIQVLSSAFPLYL